MAEYIDTLPQLINYTNLKLGELDDEIFNN